MHQVSDSITLVCLRQCDSEFLGQTRLQQAEVTPLHQPFSELGLWACTGHAACYMDAKISTLHTIIAQQALLTTKPSLQRPLVQPRVPGLFIGQKWALKSCPMCSFSRVSQGSVLEGWGRLPTGTACPPGPKQPSADSRKLIAPSSMLADTADSLRKISLLEQLTDLHHGLSLSCLVSFCPKAALVTAAPPSQPNAQHINNGLLKMGNAVTVSLSTLWALRWAHE